VHLTLNSLQFVSLWLHDIPHFSVTNILCLSQNYCDETKIACGNAAEQSLCAKTVHLTLKQQQVCFPLAAWHSSLASSLYSLSSQKLLRQN